MKTEHSLDLTAHFALEGSQPFKDRRATMPWRGAIPVAKELLSQTWQEVISQPTPPRKRLVYLHIPFCATHCTFCGFYQNRFEEDHCARYTNALLREIEMEADSALHQSAPITPSILAAVHRLRCRHGIWPESSPHCVTSYLWRRTAKSLLRGGYSILTMRE